MLQNKNFLADVVVGAKVTVQRAMSDYVCDVGVCTITKIEKGLAFIVRDVDNMTLKMNVTTGAFVKRRKTYPIGRYIINVIS